MKKVLIANNDPVLTKMLLHFSQELGMAVCTANNCDEAHKKAKSRSYDYLLIDTNVEIINGIELIKQLKNSIHNKQTETILISHATDNIKSGEVAPLFDKHIEKPFSLEKFNSLFYP